MSLGWRCDLDWQQRRVEVIVSAGGRDRETNPFPAAERRGVGRVSGGWGWSVFFRRRTAAQTASRTCWIRGGSDSAVVRSIGSCSSQKQSLNRSMSSRYETAQPKDQGQPNSECRHHRRSQPHGVQRWQSDEAGAYCSASVRLCRVLQPDDLSLKLDGCQLNNICRVSRSRWVLKRNPSACFGVIQPD